MSRLPKIAIVGRPNVGKSALFNRIIGKRIAIVDESEGVTRDRLYATTECFGKNFQLIDTGGIDAHSDAPFNEQIKMQAEIAIEEADSLILVVDAQVGATELDEEVAKILHHTKKPVCLAVNKADTIDKEVLIHNFHSLGIEKMIPVSASHGRNMAELLEISIEKIEYKDEEDVDSTPKIAIIGRPNVGKSTLTNELLQEDRCIVSEVAGTTRDSIDLPITFNDNPYLLIDTAGIRKKNKEKHVVDKFAHIRTDRAIERADICLLMIDVVDGFTHRDRTIAKNIYEAGKGCILIFNKWDLVEKIRMEHCLQTIDKVFPYMAHCPKLFISAKDGRNVEKIFPVLEDIIAENVKGISTPDLNRFISKAMQKVHPPMTNGKRFRVYYMTQVENQPPTFLLFVNSPGLLVIAYRRYLIKQLRAEFGQKGFPIRFALKGKAENKKPRTKHATEAALIAAKEG